MSANGRLLLISNSTLYGRGYLDHAEAEIRDLLEGIKRILFVPFALYDRDAYAELARGRFNQVADPRRAIDEADTVLIGGGNTFRLLKSLYDFDLLARIRGKIAAGAPYIGSSAGSIVACPTLKTTKDMPIVQPPSFDALGLVSFQISPHYLDPDPTSTHMGETQEERIKQFLEENEAPVVGLREGAMLRVEEGSIILKGVAAARIFRKGYDPVETEPGAELRELLAPSSLKPQDHRRE
jgi:dipeptidase E